MRRIELIFVGVGQAKGAYQSNKFYRMIEQPDNTFKVEYGRVGNTMNTGSYPIRKWDSIYRNKIRKGYEDITHLKTGISLVDTDSGNTDFNEFYDTFSKYTVSGVQSSYVVDGCTPLQIKKAQEIIDRIVKLKSKDDINDSLIELFKVIPRKMRNVEDFLITEKKNKDSIIAREQDALDNMDSVNIITNSSPLKELNLMHFEEVTDYKELSGLIKSNNTGYKIRKVYKAINKPAKENFDAWIKSKKYQNQKLLIHGTRVTNTFSILKSDLLVRPSNAASYAGSIYGNGIYFSDSFQKSVNYTGRTRDIIFFVSKVHLGNFYQYDGWYRHGKDLNRSQMNYDYLNSKGYDSLYVNAGDGLQRDEYISYNSEQNFINYIIWMT